MGKEKNRAMTTSKSRWAARRAEHTEYGGGEGDNRVIPGRVPVERPLTTQEMARDMRREGIRNSDEAEPRDSQR